MSARPQLFRIEPSAAESKQMQEVDFARLGFQERRDIQEWVAANPGILGDDLLVIGKEFSGFDRTNERLDLLAVDQDGRLVVIELKRDDTGADAHWQAIKYASYLRRASVEHIVEMLANYRGVSEEDAANMLHQHLGADDLNALNNDQRIILASHRFAPEVTNAVLWLNEKAPGENLITCFKLTPYQDGDTLYLQASRLIPVPDTEGLLVGLRDSSDSGDGGFSSALGVRRSQSRYAGVTPFLRSVTERVNASLPEKLKTERDRSHRGRDRITFSVWYARPPWGLHQINYSIAIFSVPDGDGKNFINRWSRYRGSGPENFPHSWVAVVYLAAGAATDTLKARLKELEVAEDGYQAMPEGDWGFNIEVERVGDALDEAFADTLAATLRRFIEVVTPVVDDFFENEGNEEEA